MNILFKKLGYIEEKIIDDKIFVRFPEINTNADEHHFDYELFSFCDRVRSMFGYNWISHFCFSKFHREFERTSHYILSILDLIEIYKHIKSSIPSLRVCVIATVIAVFPQWSISSNHNSWFISFALSRMMRLAR